MFNLKVNNRRALFITSIAVVIVTIITFGLGIFAVPISGANAPGGGIPYPYLNTFGQYPKDFIWQMVALAQILLYIVWIKVICNRTNETAGLMGSIASVFGVMASVILLANYYIQISVIPVSLKSNELEGLPLLIQYNPHGIFIVMEELGYWLMLVSLTLLSFIYGKSKVIKIIAIVIDIVVVAAFFGICLVYGIDRKDRFEVIILSMDWLMIIYLGIVFSVNAWRSGKRQES